MLKKWLLGMLMMVSIVPAWADEYQAGQQYQVLPEAVPTRDSSKIEVVEMFGYMCPHCNHFEPMIENWESKQPQDVDFHAIPVVFGRGWEELARAYYVAELMGKLDETHSAVFHAIHTERKRIFDEDSLAEFYSQFGIPEDEFKKQFNSFAVNMKLKQGQQKAQAYQIEGVPSMIVNGKYLVTGSMAGSNAQMLKVVDYLVEKERAAK